MTETRILLEPLKYLELLGDTQDPESWAYTKDAIRNRFYNIVRKQRNSPETDRARFISTFSGLFGDPPEELSPEFLGFDESKLSKRIKNPQGAVMTVIIHMEILIHRARLSGSSKDLEEIRDFIKFIEKIHIESRSQDGLSLPGHYFSALSETENLVNSNPKRVRMCEKEEVDWSYITFEAGREDVFEDSNEEEEDEEEEDPKIEKSNSPQLGVDEVVVLSDEDVKICNSTQHKETRSKTPEQLEGDVVVSSDEEDVKICTSTQHKQETRRKSPELEG